MTITAPDHGLSLLDADGGACPQPLAQLEPITLHRLDACAALQHRFDHKYMLDLARLGELVSALAPDHQRLEIGARSVFSYRSVYVDSPGLDCLHAHRQGRRLRFKARTRSYAQTGVHRFEVKLKDGRGATQKHALPIEADDAGTLTPATSSFLRSVLAGAGIPCPPELAVVLAVEHQRSTVADLTGGSRLTIDTELAFTVPGPRHRAGTGALRPGRALVETKSAHGRSGADLILRSMGVRPIEISKYCVGMCLTRPWITSHPWRPLLDRQFRTG